MKDYQSFLQYYHSFPHFQTDLSQFPLTSPKCSPVFPHPSILIQFSSEPRFIIIFQVQMSSAPSHTKRITKNHFMLRGNEKLHIKTETLVHFKPLTKNKRTNSRSILPTFLNDRKYYTCAFQLPSEIEENDQEMLEDHQKRIQESSQEISEMYLPKPRSKNKYCGVCRSHYEDYKEHVESQNHLNFLRKSPYQVLIHRFCSRLPQLLQKRQPEEQKVIEQSTAQQNSDKCPQPCEFPTPSKCFP